MMNFKDNLEAFAHLGKQKIWVISSCDKKPLQTNGQAAQSNNSRTWATLPEVLRCIQNLENALPAVVLHDHLDLIFIDLDHVIDPTNGRVQTWAQEIVDQCNSYTEKSRSGTGIHIFLHGNPPKLPMREQIRCRPPKNTWNRAGDLEIYFSKKIATITDDILVAKPIRKVGEKELFSLYRQFFPEAKHAPCNQLVASPKMSDDEIITLARSGKSGEKFSRLFDLNEWDGPEDPSAKDLSLANRLSFFTQDTSQIERIMRISALNNREKWEREDYVRRTIETALRGLKETFHPPKQSKQQDAPIPINLTTKTTGEPFPVDSLPPILCSMAKEIQRVSKAPIELCCSAVMSAASIATKRFIKVFEKEALSHHTCFFFIVIAKSGERKSSVMKKALAPIYRFQEEDKERYLQDKRSYLARQKAIQKEINTVLNGQRATDEKAKELEILQMQLESYRPRPYRYLTDDFTNAALFRLLDECNGSFAVMSLDGGNVLDYIQGRGPGTDGSMNDSLLLKATWGDPISRDRKSTTEEGEHIFINDPACHVSIVVTPERCAKFLSDSRLRDSGMIARIMPIACSSTIGTRFEEETEPLYDECTIIQYNNLINNLFKRDTLIEVYLDKDAAKGRRNFFNNVEREMACGGSLEDLCDLGSKYTTQVTRLAGLFQTCKETFTPQTDKIFIREDTWFEAESIGRWIFDQSAHLQRTDYDELVLVTAKDISEKLHKAKLSKDLKRPAFKKRDFQQRFKRELRAIQAHGKNHTIEDVLNTLVSYRWILEVPSADGSGKTQYIVNQPDLGE